MMLYIDWLYDLDKKSGYKSVMFMKNDSVSNFILIELNLYDEDLGLS